MKVAIYAAKSSPDEKGSVEDQQAQIRVALPADREVIGVYGEDNQSGYRKERGPQLEAAMRQSIEASAEDGEAELWVWHSSRLARGDGTKGKRSIQLIVAQLLYENVTVRSVADPEMVTPMLSGIASTVSNKYSQDLSDHVKRGLRKRREAGKPIGGMPYGYTVQRQIIDGQLTTRRIIDPQAGPTVVQAFAWTASGLTPGDIARRLNAQGIPTMRGKRWQADLIHALIDNPVYHGENGYPAIVDGDLAERARQARTRLDPAAAQRRKGGRPPDPAYILRGIAFCACGAPLNVTRKWTTGRSRAYLCAERIKATGVCDHRPIPAELAEQRVIEHLSLFVGDIQSWIGKQLSVRTDEHAVRERHLDALRRQLSVLEAQREARLAEIIEHGITSPIAFEVIEGIDREREVKRHEIADQEAALSEWTGRLDSDAILDFYNGIVDVVQGRIAQADGVAEVNAALHESLTGIWLSYEDKTLSAAIRLRSTGDPDLDAVAAELLGTLEPFPEALALAVPKPQPQPGWSSTAT